MSQAFGRTRKSWLRRSTLFIYNILPDIPRHWLMRKLFRLDYELPEELQFKLAETLDEFEQAFEILHDAFVESGYMDEEPSRLRVTKYHAVPGTMLLIAKLGNEVIATVSVIPDSPLGLPLESTWNIAFLREKGGRIGEVSALAIKKGYRRMRPGILFPLIKFLFEICTDYAGIDLWVISTLDRVKDFYRAYLLFQPIDGLKPKPYSFVKGVSAVAQYLDLRTYRQEFHRVYGTCRREINLHQYISETRFKQFRYPPRMSLRGLYRQMSPEFLEYFFTSKTRLFSQLTDIEKRDLVRLYHDADYTRAISPSFETLALERKEPRFSVNCSGSLVLEPGPTVLPVDLVNVARSGLELRIRQPRPIECRCTVRFHTRTGSVVSVGLEPVWQRKGQVGFRILSFSQEWIALINELDHRRRLAA